MSSMWYDGPFNRRGVLSGDALQEAFGKAGEIILFLASEGAADAEAIGVEVGLTESHAVNLLGVLVASGLVTENEGDYSSVLVEESEG